MLRRCKRLISVHNHITTLPHLIAYELFKMFVHHIHLLHNFQMWVEYMHIHSSTYVYVEVKE